jgi:hypothetical protein
MPGNARQQAPLGPAPIAIHHDGDVVEQRQKVKELSPWEHQV